MTAVRGSGLHSTWLYWGALPDAAPGARSARGAPLPRGSGIFKVYMFSVP